MNERSHGNWSIHLTEGDDGICFWHLREVLPDGVAAVDFPVLVTVKWIYADHGPPSKEVLAELQQFEKHLESMDDPRGNSVLVTVFRGEGDSELHYYCKDYEHFMKELNLALSGKPPFPISIFHEEDALWTYWEETKASLSDDEV